MYNTNDKVVKAVTKETIEDIQSYPIRALSDRSLTKETCEYFDIRVGLSEKDGSTIEAIYFPWHKNGVISGYQKKDLTIPKGEKYHFTTIGTVDADCELFGMNKAPTGGKKSPCIAVYQREIRF